MQIIELKSPTNGGSLYTGLAMSTRGRRYTFCATPTGNACSVFREVPNSARLDGRSLWLQVNAPVQLESGVRSVFHKQRRQGP